ncbi:MAG: preprotein translocase subunit SecE [Proteobacteria bacterium]|nr:preprotein translocase subunit SecE [Desulfobacterales bacterium]MBL7172609.1 preprotein translocase subunit SecE [Desulfobacteraceae bacterium]MBU0735516.1 preprotein translocase subunit SecE [Pseudomonadota bacterium]MBU1903192.1 preprotein translocase subunit SecE [Pseudomonadota bacterium]
MKKQNQKTKSKKGTKSKKSAPTRKRESVSAKSKLPQEKEKQPVTEKAPRAIQKTPRKTGEAEIGSISRIGSKVGQFLREAKMELKKVKWPTRKELLASTAVVIVLTLLVAFFLGLVDFGLIKIIKNVVG